MALEDSVNNLVTQTTALLNTVNVSKATLDASVEDAEDFAAAALTSANNASTSASTASTQASAAQVARTGAETARDGAVVAQNNAVAVVTGGTATLTPEAGKIPLADAQAKIDAGWVTDTALVEQSDIGTAPNEIPLNQYLGSMAYQDLESVTIDGGVATLGTATISSIQNNTNISETEPTLDLNFAKVKALDPRITFARASTGRYWDGKTYAKAEENLLLQSEALATSPWFPQLFPVVVNNAAVAPDGTNTASSITFTTQFSNPKQLVPTSNGASYTFSFYAKWVSGNTELRFLHEGSATGTSTIFTVTGTWTRYYVTVLGNASSGVIGFGIQDTNTSGFGEVLIWGAQLEQRSAVSSYTPTTTQPITLYQPALQTAASGVARFDHNPVTQESLGLLIEEQRTNLQTYSEDFTNAVWNNETSRTIITANSIIAPDGTLTADKFAATTANSVHRVYNFNLFISAGVATTISFYAKRNGFDVSVTDSGGRYVAIFNLATGVATSFNLGDTVSAFMVSVGNGWYRCIATITSTVSGNFPILTMSLSDGTTEFAGNEYDGYFIWGYQLETGSFPTSYIPTVASQVTRSADSASMTGTNFSSWFRQDEGTLYAEGKRIGVTTSSIATLTRASTDYYDSINIRYDGNSYGQVVNNNIVLASIASSAITTNVFAKSILAYKTDDIAYAVNAGSVGVDTSAILPTGIDTLRIGALASNTYNLNGTIKKIAYYPQRLDNAELVEMTEQ